MWLPDWTAYLPEQSLWGFFSCWPFLFLTVMATAPHLITRVTKLNTLNIPYCLENKFPPMFATQFAELMFKIMGKINRN